MIKPIGRGEFLMRDRPCCAAAFQVRIRSSRYKFGNLVFETRNSRLTVSGTLIEVTQKEFNMTLLFFCNFGRRLSWAYILKAIWARDVEILSRTMDLPSMSCE